VVILTGTEDWKVTIREYWDMFREEAEWNFPNDAAQAFLSSIWKASIRDLDGMEVQVVVDSNDNIFISSGTPSFVSFMQHEDELTKQTMKIPIKAWIHTHPFGSAYFSSVDWSTINTWETIMDNAIVLGRMEYYSYHIPSDKGRKVFFGDDGEIKDIVYYMGDEEE
jgi:proteasome lid subunit RPN8/RPN11|tara:strand:+ start:281 stop:778 length:498 start_codon:yes stop_codon:yes gene_type:complete